MDIENEKSTESVRRLAQYRPFVDGGRQRDAVLEELVLAATAMNGGAFQTLAECRDGFQSLWGLDVEVEEIRNARDRLEQSGACRASEAGVALAPETVARLDASAIEAAQVEATALEEWEASVRAAYPQLTDDNVLSLREDLERWIGHVVSRHGAEAALLLYPDDPRAKRLLDELDGNNSFLPSRPGVQAIRDSALRLFVRQATDSQRTYLSTRLNTAFYLTVLTLDPAAAALTREVAAKCRLYLDTNFLYSLLGMAPVSEAAAATRLLELTKGLGYQIAVTSWTLEELRTSIKRAERDTQLPLYRPEMARVLAEISGEKGYAAAYWREALAKGISRTDFFERVSHPELELPRLGVEIVDEGCPAVLQNSALVAEYASMLDRVAGRGQRHPDVLEHDARHRVLVERLRGSSGNHFSSARYWFITQDTRVSIFARLTRDEGRPESDLPFCLSPSTWAQIMRALTPRTADFDQTVVDLLTSPYVGYRPAVPVAVVREVVARMDLYEHASPDLALAVLMDSAHVAAIADAPQEELSAAVNDAFSEKFKEMQSEVAAHAERARREGQARAEADERAATLERDLKDEQRRREGLATDLARASEKSDAMESRLAAQLQESEQKAATQIATERTKREELEQAIAADKDRVRRRHRRIAGAATGVVPLVVLIWLLVSKAIEKPWSVAFAIGAGLALCYAGLNIAVGDKWLGRFAGPISFFLGVAGVVAAFLTR